MSVLGQDSPTGWGVLGLTALVKGRTRVEYPEMAIIKVRVTQEILTAATYPSTLSGMHVFPSSVSESQGRRTHIPPSRGMARVK